MIQCTVCTVSTVPVQWLGPVPQSATNTRAVQISAKISVERSITYLWWFQDDFNRGKEKWLCQVTLDQCVIQFEWSLRGLNRGCWKCESKWYQESKHNALHITFLWKPQRDPWIWLPRPWRSHAGPSSEVLWVASSQCRPGASGLAEADLQAKEIIEGNVQTAQDHWPVWGTFWKVVWGRAKIHSLRMNINQRENRPTPEKERFLQHLRFRQEKWSEIHHGMCSCWSAISSEECVVAWV